MKLTTIINDTGLLDLQIPMEEKRNRLLIALYELYVATKSVNVDTDKLAARADVGEDFYNIPGELGLKGKGWLELRNQVVRIHSLGIQKAEELLNTRTARLERTILQKFYDLGGPNHMEWVLLDTLTRELNLRFSDIRLVLNDLEDRGLLEGNGEAMWLTWKGVREVENPSSNRAGGNYFETHIHNSQGFAVGENITQSINITNDFRTAIRQLLTGVERSTSLSVVEKINLTGEIGMLEQLGEIEKTDEVIKAADAKINDITSVLSTTADLVSLGMVVIPVIRASFGL